VTRSMWFTPLLLCLGLARVADEFQEHLARLADPRANERAAAERWLEANLGFERYPDLAEAARAGDAEVRGRIARILAAEDRHLALALALCGERMPELTRLGRDAVRASVARARPELELAPQREGLEILLQRAASSSLPRPLSLDTGQPLARLAGDLEWIGDLPLGVTLDPRVAGLASRREPSLAVGPWNEVLLRLSGTLGVGLEVHGVGRRRGADPEGGFLHLAPRGEVPRTGVELVTQWLVALAGEGDPSVRALAATNLVAADFQPALPWMERLVRQQDDRPALEGLLLAASRGHVASVLLEPERLARLLAEAEGDRSGRILAALENLGCFDARGQPLVRALLEGFPAASARARWIRLALLEHNGCACPELDATVRPLLADPATPPALVLQALHARASLTRDPRPVPLAWADPSAVFRLPQDAEGLERLGRSLRRLGIAPPDPEASALRGPAPGPERRALLQAWLWSGAVEPSAAHVASWLAASREPRTGEALADELRPWEPRGERALLAQVLLRARERAPELGRDVDRVRLLLGLVPEDEVPSVLAEGRFELAGDAPDLALLGALAGYPARIAAQELARASLVSLLREAVSSGAHSSSPQLLAALDRASQGLFAAGRDREGNELVNAVRQILRRRGTSAGDPREGWPSAPFLVPFDPAAALARRAVPAGL